MTTITLLDLLHHANAFRPWFKDPKQWGAWRTFLKSLYGLPLSESELATFQAATGRTTAPTRQHREAWLCCGVRSGKSLVLAALAVTVACTGKFTQFIVPGESLKIPVIAADKVQAGVIMGYIREMLNAPAFRKELKRELADSFELNNGLTIEVHAASFRGVRGFTAPLICCDESAFWMNSETSANPDVEILRALRPRTATIPNSMLLCASSPYAKKGALYQAYRDHFGKDDSDVLFWKSDTATMHPPDAHLRSIIDQAYRNDPESAAAEFGGEFREGISDFISREVVESAVDVGVYERPPELGKRYQAFVDSSGGSSDSFTMGIAHKEPSGLTIVDFLKEWAAPFRPNDVIAELAPILKRYKLHSCVGDRYAAGFQVDSFRANGITLEYSKLSRSEIYLETLPLINSGKVRLLDNRRAINQLCALERHVTRSGKDNVDHPRNGRDDLCNSLCGALVNVMERGRGGSGSIGLHEAFAEGRRLAGLQICYPENEKLKRREMMWAVGRYTY
jgi:hypothetical protein